MKQRDKYNNKQLNSFTEIALPDATNITHQSNRQLSNEQSDRIQLLLDKIHPTSYESVIAFGQDAQQKVQQFSSNLMQVTRKSDPLKVQKILEEMASLIEQIDPDELIEKNNGLFSKLFRKPKRTIQQTTSEYRKLSKYVDRLAIQLQHAQQQLLSQQRQLNSFFEQNAAHFEEISIHLLAIQMKSQQITTEIAQSENNSFDSENFGNALSTEESLRQWLDQMHYNLQLSQEVARQSAFQIQMVQKTNQMLIEKVQTSIMATIPLWQSQIATILSLGEQHRTSQMHEKVTKNAEHFTNKLEDAIERVRYETEKEIASSGSKVVTSASIEQFKATQLRLLDEIEEALKLELDN